MRRFLMTLISFLSIIFCNCHKSNSSKLTNCDNLQNDPPINDGSLVVVPNAFTPNNDGLNDRFRPIAIKIANIKFTVFDKNYDILFYSEQIGQGWQPIEGIASGTKYYYRIEAETPSGRKIGRCGVFAPYKCVPKDVDKLKLTFEDQVNGYGEFINPTSERLQNCN